MQTHESKEYVSESSLNFCSSKRRVQHEMIKPLSCEESSVLIHILKITSELAWKSFDLK